MPITRDHEANCHPAVARLLRHEAMILRNEARAALPGWRDWLMVAALALGALIALRTALAPLPLLVAATGVALFGAATGLAMAWGVERRLDFLRYDGVIAADALSPRAGWRYRLALHGLAGGGVAVIALIGRPTTAVFAAISFLLGIGAGYLTRGMSLANPAGRIGLRHLRAWFQHPASGVLAALLLILALSALRTLAPVPRAAVIGGIGAVFALSVSALDPMTIRFMAIAGHPPLRIAQRQARALLLLVLLAVGACLVLADELAALALGGVGAAALALMIARVLAYHGRSRRGAELVVSLSAAVVCGAALLAPMLLPVILIALFWRLYARARQMRWVIA